MSMSWYLARLRRMGPRELARRLRDEALKRRWRPLKGRPAVLPDLPAAEPMKAPALPAFGGVGTGGLLGAADELLAGRLRIFGRETALPREGQDWFRDPESGLVAPSEPYAFDIDARNPAVVGNHKLLLEPSRLQHAPLLAAAYALSGREAYAELAVAQLGSWWKANPFLAGVHWTSGIEVGLRLVSFAWTRRLLSGWTGARVSFEESPLARQQIYRHLQYLAAFRSHGSSANNHLLAELLGLYVGASAFPWFSESAGWRAAGARGLEAEAARQVFPDGLSREQASEYHGFVLEILLVAAVEGLVTGRPLSADFHAVLVRMADAWAALLDRKLRPPRQGDTDEGRVLVLDATEPDRRPGALLAAAGALVGAAPWWPAVVPDVRSRLFAALASGSTPDRAARRLLPRPARRPQLFADAGLALLRDLEPREDELWCRCDHGPHGYLSIAAHAHADALSIELRHGGVDILADPGTYCYLTERPFRRYFRSTVGHNTLEIGGRDQARFGGPFLWLDAPRSHLLATKGLDAGPAAEWSARHEGYRRLPGRPVHERSVRLDRQARSVRIADSILASRPCPVRLAFHLGPAVEARLDGCAASLAWFSGSRRWHGRLLLPDRLAWRAVRGSLDPIGGWYSPAFGERVPSTTFIGEGTLSPGVRLETILDIGPSA